MVASMPWQRVNDTSPSSRWVWPQSQTEKGVSEPEEKVKGHVHPMPKTISGMRFAFSVSCCSAKDASLFWKVLPNTCPDFSVCGDRAN